MKLPPILDPCCGSRMWHYDKSNPLVLFADNRALDAVLSDGRRLVIKPDMQLDYRRLPFADASFWQIIFDPPHLLKVGSSSWLAAKYGRLDQRRWRGDLAQAFDELFRILKPSGSLLLKWSARDIPLLEVLKLAPYQPVIGSRRKKSGMGAQMALFFKSEEMRQ